MGGRQVKSITDLVSISVLFTVIYASLDPTIYASIDPLVAYNSDFVQVFLMVQDALGGIEFLRGWQFSPALYIFPDWFIAFPLVVSGMPGALLLTGYAGLQLALISMASGFLISTVLPVSRRAATWGSAALLALLFGLSFMQGTAFLSWQVVAAFGAPYIHTGAALMALAASALLFSYFKREDARYLAWLAPVVFATTLSDFSFLPWFVVPAVTVTLLRDWKLRRRSTILCALTIVASAGTAVLVERVLRDGGGVGLYHLTNAARSAALFLNDVGRALAGGDVLLASMILIVVSLLARSAAIALKLLRGGDLAERDYLDLFLGGVCACTVAAPVVTGLYSDPAHWRYMSFVYLVAPIWLYIVAGGWLLRNRPTQPRHPWAFAIALAIAAALLLPRAANAVGNLLRPSALEACLRQHGRTEGLSDYWMAKVTILASDRRLHLAQLRENGERYFWNYNADWFETRADNRNEPIHPDFIITDRLEPGALVARFGTPAERVDCDGHEVWLYSRPVPWKWGSASIPGVALPRSQGVVDETSVTIADGAGTRGVFTYGPYFSLIAGDYVLTLTYAADAAGNSWDVSAEGAMRTLSAGELAPTQGSDGEVKVGIHVERRLSDVEFRTKYSGLGRLTVYCVAVEPAGSPLAGREGVIAADSPDAPSRRQRSGCGADARPDRTAP